MIIYPAIDLRDGRVVRLAQGDFARETIYGDDPMALAQSYADTGAAWLHLVDLDAAKSGRFRHLELIADIAAATGLHIQCGGGVRETRDVESLLTAGVSRVVVGSVAVRDPARVQGWLDRFGAERIAVALDTRADDDGIFRLPVSGWTEATGTTLDGTIDAFARHGALRHVLCTDIARDGMLSGPNLALYEAIRAHHPAIALQVSGGVRDLDDVRAARALGAAGIVVGKALLTGLVTLPDLLAC